MQLSNARHVTSIDAAVSRHAAAGFVLADLHLDVLADPQPLEAEWRTLEALPRNSLHQGFDWCSAWWAAHGTPPVILRGRLGNRTVMILPLERSMRFGLSILSMPGGRFNNLNSGLFSADFPVLTDEELRQLSGAVRDRLCARADLLVIDTFTPEWKDVQHPLGHLVCNEHPTRAFQLPLRVDIDETIRQLNSRTRKRRYRIQCRRLEAAGGFEHIRPDNALEQHTLLDLFFEQKGRRLATFGLPDVFRPARVRTFLHALIDRSRDGSDRPLVMHAIRLKGANEGRIAAIAGLSRKGGHVICQFSSIDETLYPEASPGDLLFRLMIEQAIAEAATVFDFGLGDQPYKRSWCTHETVLYDILLPLGRRGRVAAPLLVALASVKLAVKKRPRLYAWAQKLRMSTGG